MRIISFKRVNYYIENHKDSRVALQDWYHKTSKEKWNSISDIKNTFNHTDYVGNSRFVFNIKGNQYRMVAIIIFASQKVYIQFIGTHSEYDKIDCRNI